MIGGNSCTAPTNEIPSCTKRSTLSHRVGEDAYPDTNKNDNFKLTSYTLSKDECFSIRVKEVAGGRKVPELILAKVLDREKKAVHKLLLTALDGGSPVRSGTAQITIRVLDINDNVPAFEKTSYKVSVSENAVEGALIVQTKATDMDDGQNGEIEYSFGAHTSDAMMSIFIIDHISGTIFLKGKLDFEANANYELDISAKDKGTPRMEGHCTVHVEVIDVNDNAPEIMLTSHPKPVREDSPNGTVVALISARDLDSGDNGKVRLQLPKTSQFVLKPSFSHNYALVTSGPLDREKVSEYNIEITATDSGSPPLSSKKIIPVTVTDVNDNPPVFTQRNYNVYLKENGVPGSILYSISASDLDFGENAKVSYSILDSKVQDVSKKSTHNLFLAAIDGGNPVKTGTSKIIITVLDINDNVPLFENSFYKIAVEENIANGSFVITTKATDIDEGPNGDIEYSLGVHTPPSVVSLFYIDAVKKPLDREKNAFHQLLLTALDGGTPVTSGTCKITITVLDNNDNFPVFSENEYKVVLKENITTGTFLVKLTATDADDGLNGEVRYSFGSRTPDSVLSTFAINVETGEIILKGPLDYESNKYYLIDITAKDRGVPEMEGHSRVQLDIEDINDNAPEIVLTSDPSPVPEDARSGTVVALISARDLDSGENGKVTLHLSKSSPFALKPSFSNNYELITSGPLDRERSSEYNIEIKATDSGSPPLSSKKIIPVTITDVNDNAPVFTQKTYNVYLKENGVPGSILYSVSASDLDFVLIVIVVALHLLFYFNTSQNDDPQSFILRHTVNITFCNVLFLSLTHRFVV
uniref:Cadherin domain-containing protein n=1 Tax=Haplochromis burtoni TaxID=8153 RepID=A0A3Q2X010_HAPBU